MVVIDGMRVRSRDRVRSWAFLHVTAACRVWVTAAVASAVVLPFVLDDLGRGPSPTSATVTGLLLVGLSVLNVEIGRILEGGASDSQRPHKGLSAWALASALLLPTWWLLPVVTVTYAHAWARGLRVTPWKWIGSAAYVVLAALAAAITAQAVLGDESDLTHGDGLLGLVAVLGAAAAFLAVETALFHGSAYLNHAADEGWLRRTLATPSFYLTEAGVLLIGGLSAAIWSAGTWLVLLLAPVYLLTQRAALHEPLRERAEHDDKTGALRFESWRRLATAAADRCARHHRSWSVLFADLDHFRAFNEAWGHLLGDEALTGVAGAIRSELRAGDLFGRFGGEEFCAFLSDVTSEEAGAIAERIRARVSATSVPGASPVTISIGVAVALPTDEPLPFASVLSAADRALYQAKNDGRDRTRLVTVDPA